MAASSLENLLNSVQGQQGALMSAYAQGNPVTGGSMPLPVDEPTGEAAPAPQDPFAALLAGLSKRRSQNRPLSMLEQLAQGGRAAHLVSPVEGQGGPQGLAGLASLTTHGPRANQAKFSYDEPGGYRRNVYVDPLTGRRSVQRFKA